MCALLAFVFATGSPLYAAAPAFAARSQARQSAAAKPKSPEELPALPVGAVEDVSRRSECVKHYRLPDGSMTAVISEEPVHFKETDGSWVDIDTTLVFEASSGRMRTTSSRVSASFGSESSRKQPARIEAAGKSVGIDFIGSHEGPAIASGSSARFKNVALGTDLVYEMLPGGVKETLELSSPLSPNTFQFFMSTEGLKLRRDFTNGWVLADPSTGELTFELGDLIVFDSSENSAGDPAYCPDATMTVSPVKDGGIITYEVSRDWLTDPARVYPIYVDPTLTSVSAVDTYISSKYPTTAYGSSTELRAGYYDATTGVNRSFLKFDVSSIPSYAKIDSATFSIYQFHTYYTNTATATYLYRQATAWSGTTTWNTRPGSVQIASQSVAGRNVWVNWSQPAVRDLVAGWVKGTTPNFGLACQQLEDGKQNTTHWRKFYSKEYANAALRPKLVVNYTTTLDPVTDLSASSHRAFDWYREVDRNSDNIADTPNDLPRVGRGAVDLRWAPTARATGYKIMMYDGDSYEQVGRVFGGGTNTWSSEGLGIAPTDSEVKGWAPGSRNALTRAASPRAATKEDEITVLDEDGAGIVVTDGTYLYVRAWGSYAGSTAWKKVGTGLNGTIKDKDYGTVGPSFGTRSFFSAFYLDGFLYNGWANDPTTITGVAKSATAESTQTATFKFDKPLLVRSTALPVIGTTGNILLTTDGERIYNVCYALAGGTENGYTIRVYDRTGKWLFDKTIPMASEYINGVFADGTSLYFMQWTYANDAHVTKIRCTDFAVANQWPINQLDTSVISGCYDPATNQFWLGSLYSGKVYRYAGPGLDLRDDPERLYEKSTTTAYYDNHNYWFRVVPFNALGEDPPTMACAAYAPTLDNRTVRVNDMDQDTVYDIGEVAEHTLSSALDEGTLEVDTVDLAIASYGPEALVARHYNSASTAVGMLEGAPGWRFDFERTIKATSYGAAYVDAAGTERRFALNGGTYHAPNGSYDRLTFEASSNQWVLMHKDRSREVFDANNSGRLIKVTDKHGNEVTYTWSSASLVIKAENGQLITVNRSGNYVTAATYSTPDGMRKMAYSSTAGVPKVTRYAGDSACEYSVEYAYTASRLAAIQVVAGTAAAENPLWRFEYGGDGLLTKVLSPLTVGAKPEPKAVTEFTRTGTTVKVTTYADAYSQTGGLVTGTSVEQSYVINPTGTAASVTTPRTSAEPAVLLWTYKYSPANETVEEVSPTGKSVRRQMNSRGNVLYEWDEEGHRSAYSYDALDQLSREMDPRGCTTYYTYGNDCYGGTGEVTTEERQLTESARSCTEYEYTSAGLLSQKRERIDASTWATTQYGDFALSGEPQSITSKGVKRSVAEAPVDLIETKSIDTLGSVIEGRDAAGVLVMRTAYDSAGRSICATDAAGVGSVSDYDKLGRVVRTYRRTDTGATVDLVEHTFDAAGRVTKDTYRLSGEPTPASIIEHAYDASSREVVTDNSRLDGLGYSSYDARGNLTHAWAENQSAGGVPTRMTYDMYGQLLQECAPTETNGTVTSYYPNGLVQKVIKPDGSWTAYTYDDGGLKLTETVPAGGEETAVTTFAYDIGGRLISTAADDGAVTAYTYDQLGRQVSAGAGDQAASTTVYNTLGWVLSQRDADGVTKTFAYDSTGRVLAATDAGAPTTTTYDSAGRTGTILTPDGATTTYAYDAFSRLVLESAVTSSGVNIKETETAYDELSRVTVAHTEQGQARTVRETRASYPAGARDETITVLGNGETTTTVSYDGSNREATRVTESSAPGLTWHADTYDAAQRLTAWSFRGVGSTRSFDTAGRLSAQSGEGFTTGATATYSFDETTGRKTGEQLPLALSNAETSSYSYTETGRLASAKVGNVTTSYTYETGSGNLSGVARASELATAFAYDEGNRIETVKVGGSVVTAFTWDTATGRRTAQGPLSDPGRITYTYDPAGRLAQYADAASGTSASYTYDTDGQRTTSVVAEGSSVTTTTYTYDGLTLLNLAAESHDETATSGWKITYLADGAGRPYGGIHTSGETTPVAFGIVTTDRGDVRELTDSSGASFCRYDYDAYGNPTRTLSVGTTGIDAATAATIAEHSVLRYAGYCYDEHSSLYYLSQRYYDPATASFITKDPAKADGEESAYQYCGGDPVGKVDPSGEFAQAIAIPVGGAVITVQIIVDGLLVIGVVAVSGYAIYTCYQRFKSKPRWVYNHPYHSWRGYKTMVSLWNTMKGTRKTKLAWFAAHHWARPHFHLIAPNGQRLKTI